MTTKLALDLPDSFAEALARKHPSGDLHEAAAMHSSPTLTPNYSESHETRSYEMQSLQAPRAPNWPNNSTFH